MTKLSDIDYDIALVAFKEAVSKARADLEALAARLPAGSRPTPGQISAILDPYVSGDVIASLVASVKAQLVSLLVTGKGPIERDDSSMA